MTAAMYEQAAAKRAQTNAEKLHRAENDRHAPLRSFVRVELENPNKAYHGMVGQVHSHNDLATPQHPNIPKEVGVKFTPTTQPVWFLPSELRAATKPKGWDVEAAAQTQ